MQASLLPLLVLLLQVCLVQLDDGMLCESAGQCLRTSRCESDDQKMCFPPVKPELISVSYEPSSSKDESIVTTRQSCETKTNSSSMNLTDMELGPELSVDYISTSHRTMSVCVSWSVTKSNSHNGGFEVQLLRHFEKWSDSLYHFCVMDSTRRQVCINNLQYGDLSGHDHMIKVLPFPLALDDFHEKFSRRITLRKNITGCADIRQMNGSFCGLKRYEAPENVTMKYCLHQNGTKDLFISWNHPSEAVVPPDVYYLSVYAGVKGVTFKVTDTTRVTIKSVNSSLMYSVYIQPYRNCSGIGDYYVVRELGCGVYSKMMRVVEECPLISPPDNVSISFVHSTPGHESLNGIRFYLIIFGVAAIILALSSGVILVSAVFAFKHCQNTSLKNSLVYPEPVQNTKIFVFYAPSMSECRLRALQERIICPLLEYFEVVTPNDISSGNISIWLEDTVKSVDCIFLVGNKEFCCDWKRSKEERSPVMNSLELLISSAAAHNAISRFGFVSAEDNIQDVFIPDNSYLKLMPIFLLGQKTFDIDKLYQFVTKSHGIELRTET